MMILLPPSAHTAAGCVAVRVHFFSFGGEAKKIYEIRNVGNSMNSRRPWFHSSDCGSGTGAHLATKLLTMSAGTLK